MDDALAFAPPAHADARERTLALFIVTPKGDEVEMTRGMQHLPHLMRILALAIGVAELVPGVITKPDRSRFADRIRMARLLTPALDNAIMAAFHMEPEAWLRALDVRVQAGCSFVTDEVDVLETAGR